MSRDRVTLDAVWNGTQIYSSLTTSNYKQGLCSHFSTHVTDHIGHARSFQSVTVFTGRCSIAASNGGRSPSSGFPKYPRHQLPASQSKSSRQLTAAVL
jgi:hypothetical protein